MTNNSKTVWEIMVEGFIAQMENGKVNFQMGLIPDMLRPAYSWATGKEYNFANSACLNIQETELNTDYACREYIGRKQLFEMGGHLKKGAKQRKIIAYFDAGEWELSKTEEGREKLKLARETGAEIEGNKRLGVRYYPVFNIMDTDLKPKHKIETPEPVPESKKRKMAEHIIASYFMHSGCKLQQKEIWTDTTIGGFYSLNDDSVNVPTQRHFNPSDGYYSVIFHEMGHSTGAEHRLNRRFGRKATKDYNYEELVAELTSAFIMKHCGIEIPSIKENNIAYMKRYIDMLKKDPRSLFSVLPKAKQAMDYIISFYNPTDTTDADEPAKEEHLPETKPEPKLLPQPKAKLEITDITKSIIADIKRMKQTMIEELDNGKIAVCDKNVPTHIYIIDKDKAKELGLDVSNEATTKSNKIKNLVATIEKQENEIIKKGAIQVIGDVKTQVFLSNAEEVYVNEKLLRRFGSKQKYEYSISTKKPNGTIQIRKNGELVGIIGVMQPFEKNKLKERIKDWYTKEYKEDTLGEDIRETATFFTAWNDTLTNGNDFYEYIGVGDSIVRERVFEEIAKRANVNYETVYKTWLKNAERKKH